MKTPAIRLLLVICFAAAGFVTCLADGDDTASRVYLDGRKLYEDGEYYAAAKKFEEARFYAKAPGIRANTLIAQMSCYRMCKLYYREFKIIEELLERYPDRVNCSELIAREFEIGALFRQGVREPAFWVFRWVPYLLDEDRTAEVYAAALKRSPYSKYAPAGHMQLAIHYELEGETLKSLAELRTLLKNHPGAPESKYALLALANGLFVLAEHGDGDGRYINEAVERLREFCRRYPDASETDFARRRLAQARDIRSRKLFEIAEFYRKNGRSEVAERYLAQIVNDYPDSEKASDAEAELVRISENYLPLDAPVKNDPRLPDIRSYRIPDNAELLLISPLDRDSHYLQPVPDLRGEKLRELSAKKDAAAKTAKEEGGSKK